MATATTAVARPADGHAPGCVLGPAHPGDCRVYQSAPPKQDDRGQLIAALVWLRANLGECPAVMNKGTTAGWCPADSEAWEQNLEAVDAILRSARAGDEMNRTPEPRDAVPGMFVLVTTGEPAAESVPMASGGTTALHARADRERCLPGCRACAEEPAAGSEPAQHVPAMAAAGPAGSAARAEQLGRAGVAVDTSITATSAGAPGASDAVCVNCLSAGHVIDDCMWTKGNEKGGSI